MHPRLEQTLQLSFFKEEGFMRRTCNECGTYFWTLDEDQTRCGDAPCVPYTFIKNPSGKKLDLRGMRETFLSFFERNNHTRLNRYPVVARWRNDIYLTIASIADFQPHVTSGLVPPPANPLVISQPSIRLNDLEQVGKSGRHLTLFEMMGHHTFNNHQKVYWTEETTRLCHEFLKSLNITDVTYKEAEWSGGGNAGACLEVLTHGLEIATLVFMNLQEKTDGLFEVKGAHYAEMPLRVVDTGYGLERFVWLTHGSPTIYDAIFPYAIKKIKRHATDDTANVYIVADHGRCLAFMLADGIVPSNAGAGYLARLIIRRSLRFMKTCDYDDTLFSVVDAHIASLSRDFPELADEKNRIHEILDIETEKYQSSMSKGRALVKRHLEKTGTVTVEDLIEFYDSHGIHPELIKDIADVEIPPDFEAMVAERHLAAKQEGEKTRIAQTSTECIPLYYKNDYDRTFTAKIISVDGTTVELDQTLFYPEGGGQHADTGTIVQGTTVARVTSVQKKGESILHILDRPLKMGLVKCELDWERRMAMMRHHTATHIVNAAARSVLGSHIWQAGSELDECEARLDITHYRRINNDEMDCIEQNANRTVMQALPVEKSFVPREDAERRFGFRLYQGGAPKSSVIRVVRINDVETEACGGMHVNNTAEVGPIKLIEIERVQDGVERIRFCAGEKAISYVQKRERLLQEAATITGGQPENLVRSVTRLANEWKQLRKEVETLQKQVGEAQNTTIEDIKIKKGEFQPSVLKELTNDAQTFAVSGISLKTGKAMITIARSVDLPIIDAAVIAKEIVKKYGGRGGGRSEIAQVGGFDAEHLEEVKEWAVELAKQQHKKAKLKKK